MNRISLTILLSFFTLTSWGKENLHYQINLNDRSNDTFKINLKIDDLDEGDSIYQFASTAPGTYQVMDIGRFVKNFQAFDKKGRQIVTSTKSVNQFRISKPKKVKTITYEIAETWDTPVVEHPIYRMAGSSFEDDHALINPHCLIGFPITKQSSPISLSISYPEEWKIGTALKQNVNGSFLADNYDHLIDSPILLGELTKASKQMGNTNIEMYTYSKTGLIKSEVLLNDMTSLLNAAENFLNGFPVDRYTFLFHFEDQSYGAWEHSYSSEYVLREQPYTKEFSQSIMATAAHEFFHIVTPLNIHSEIIGKFNFTNPTLSKHLWLYEGVTEWASDIMQLRSGLLSIEELLEQYHNKLLTNDLFDQTYSLQDIALKSYTKKGVQQYSNIYMKGAIIASLLDIRLLELSNGKSGLRELVLQLSKKYGKNRSFSEDSFFYEIVDMTYPEIESFLNNYIVKAEPLPLNEYFNKIGIIYSPLHKIGDDENTIIKHHFRLMDNPTKEQQALRESWSKNF